MNDLTRSGHLGPPHGIGSPKATMSLSTCGSELRFIQREGKLVLQQIWSVTQTEGGYPIRGRTEWRDVPLVLENP